MNSHALLIMAIPAVVAVSGGALAAVWKPSHQVRSLIQHFAAGVILAALAVELLPDIGKEHATKEVVLGAFAAGSLFMYALKLWTEKLEGRYDLSPLQTRQMIQEVVAARYTLPD